MDRSKYEDKRTLRYKEEEDEGEEEEEEEEEGEEEEEEEVREKSYGDEYGTRKRTMADLYNKRGSKAGSSIPPSCQVESCDSDLTDAKQYHRRHKVCEYHSKAPDVLIGGQQQRFCQQCSRFHELSEFDDLKRSCRKRLAGHNWRRRKNAIAIMENDFIDEHKASISLK